LKENKTIAAMVHCYDNFETAYITIQILHYWNFFDKIFVYFPKGIFNDRVNDIKNISNKIEIKFINHLRNINIKDMYSADILYQYYRLNDYLGFDYTFVTFQDIWLLDFKRYKIFFDNMIKQNSEILSYYTPVEGDIATDMFILKNSDNVKNIMISDSFRNIQYAEFEKIFGHEVQTKLNGYYINTKENKIHQYGYNSILGKAHVHTIKQKLHYINMFEKLYNIKLSYNKDLLEENKSNTSDIQHQHLAKNLEDNEIL